MVVRRAIAVASVAVVNVTATTTAIDNRTNLNRADLAPASRRVVRHRPPQAPSGSTPAPPEELASCIVTP